MILYGSYTYVIFQDKAKVGALTQMSVSKFKGHWNDVYYFVPIQ